MPLAPGTRLGPYEVISLLGIGGMGEVYRARDSRLGRDVALKILSGEALDDSGRYRRFEQEARAASQIADGLAAAGSSADPAGGPCKGCGLAPTITSPKKSSDAL